MALAAVLGLAGILMADEFTNKTTGERFTGALIGRVNDILVVQTDTGERLRLSASRWQVALMTRPSATRPMRRNKLSSGREVVKTGPVTKLPQQPKPTLRLGMTADEVLGSWGRPDSTNVLVTEWGRHEQWIYGGPLRTALYVYLDDGLVTAWQVSR
jgi:hypothetical protein